MNWKEFGEKLEKKVKINKKALKISEKGVSMTNKEYPGTFVSVPKTFMGDAILFIDENPEITDTDSIRYIIKIDHEGAVFLKDGDNYFSEKLQAILDSCKDYEKLYVYDWNNALYHIRKFIKNLPSEITDLKENFKKYKVDKPLDLIKVPWDRGVPIFPGFSIDDRMLEGDIYGTIIRIYSLYLIIKFEEFSPFTVDPPIIVDTEEDIEKVNLTALDL